MRLKLPRDGAEIVLKDLLDMGRQLLDPMLSEYDRKWMKHEYKLRTDHERNEANVNLWSAQVVKALASVFPTELETLLFRTTPPRREEGETCLILGCLDQKVESDLIYRLGGMVHGLEIILAKLPSRYTDIPLGTTRIYVEDVDCFQNVRYVNPGMVAELLNRGSIDLARERVSGVLNRILDGSFHGFERVGGATGMYLTYLFVNGARRLALFLLMEPKVGSEELAIADPGLDDDGWAFLFTSPADLVVIQCAGQIEQVLVDHVERVIRRRDGEEKNCQVLFIDRLDTARLMYAYGAAESVAAA